MAQLICMRRWILSLFLLIAATAVHAQDDIPVRTLPTEIFKEIKKDPKDTVPWTWKRGGLFNLNLSQGSLSNWAAGGDNFALAITSYFNYFVFHRKNKHTWDNNLDFNFGFVQATSTGGRKNDDRLDFVSKYGLQVDTSRKFYATGLVNFRTQFFDGYTYDGNSGTLASTLLSPAYLLISGGFEYRPFQSFSVFLSPVTSRWTVVLSKRLYPKGVYGIPAGQRAVNEFGAFASVNFSKNFGKSVTYKGRMDLFSNYKHNPGNIDLYMTNIIAFKINKYLSATYNLDLIYDDDVKLFGKDKSSPALQAKSLIGIGFLMNLAPVIRMQ